MKTLKAVAARYNATSLILRIVIGLAVGVVLALAVPGAGWVEEFGSLFVGALKGIAPVLVFVIVASALAQGTSRLDRRFGTVIWLYMLTTFLAAAIASITSFMFPVSVVLADAAQSDVVPQGLGEVLGTLLTNFVANPVSSLMSGNYIGILFWACMFGLAMKNIGSDTTKKFLADTADAVSQVVRWIINLAPFGIMGLVYTNVAGNGLAIFTQYGKLLALLGLNEEGVELTAVPLPALWPRLHAACPDVSLRTPAAAPTVRGDADLLLDLLCNLVQNAAKASAPGAPVLVLCAQAGDAVTLTVADRGCGIPPELIPRVTEPFYMVDKSRARRQGGSGLGLALCQRIAAAHGSALRIESEPGRGTRVSVTLPVWKEDAP